MSMEKALQDQMPAGWIGAQCFGCGRENEHGLRIKSYWEGDEVVCNWQPQPYHTAGANILCGGIIATIMDCHSLWTALAAAYRNEGREVGSGQPIFYITRSIKIDLLHPTPVESPVTLRARVQEMGERSATVACSLYSQGTECARLEGKFVRLGI